MSEKRYIVKLTSEERADLELLVRQGRCAGWKIQRAEALLAFDSSDAGLGWPDERVAEAYRCTSRVVEMWRKQAALEGPRSLLNRKAREPRPPKLDGEAEARLVALACSAPPEGRDRWTLRLLADRMVELEVVSGLSYETVRRGLKKTSLSLGAR
jgi:transposase